MSSCPAETSPCGSPVPQARATAATDGGRPANAANAANADPGLVARLQALMPPWLRGLRRGIEKESLRTRRDGFLALTPHPAELGSALAHPHITTDFSEAQLELITGVHASATACLDELIELHQFVYRHIGDEILWGASMPCGLPEDDGIPLAHYGNSNVGRAKTVYRQGLSHRYGRRMQTISGIHYNFSLPDAAWAALQRVDEVPGTDRDYRDARYFGLIRNFRRHSWLLLYLFGASPAICGSFLDGHEHGLEWLGPGTLGLPHATSLRMGPLGYQSDAQASLAVSFNCLESYAASLSKALSEPWPAYEAIGVDDGNGGYHQLATTLLQIENEFYGTIRPKRSIRPGERPLRALAERGVEYVEVRCLDIDPFETVGIGAQTMHFLDVFLLHCLLADSAPDTPQQIGAISRNQYRVAQHGREPGLLLDENGHQRSLREWGESLLEACEPIAAALDAALLPQTRAQQGSAAPHREALASARRALADTGQTPSARQLGWIRSNGEGSFRAFALARSLAHRDELLARALDPQADAHQQDAVQASIAAQKALEAADSIPFEIYRQRYVAGELGSSAGT